MHKRLEVKESLVEALGGGTRVNPLTPSLPGQ